MKIKKLPFSVIWQLCRYLDVNNQQNWRALLTHAPADPYTALDVAAFARVGFQPNGSSTEAVIQDFIVRGLTVDDLFSMLYKMRHIAGMKILQEYVSPHNQELLESCEKGDESDHDNPPAVNGYPPSDDSRSFTTVSSTSQDPLDSPSPPSPPSVDIHPEFGPLPSNPPLVSRGPYPPKHSDKKRTTAAPSGIKIEEEGEAHVSEQQRRYENGDGKDLVMESDGGRYPWGQGRHWLEGEVEADSPRRERRAVCDTPSQERQGSKPMALVAPKSGAESKPNVFHPQPDTSAAPQGPYGPPHQLTPGTRTHASWPLHTSDAVDPQFVPPVARQSVPIRPSEPPSQPMHLQWQPQAPISTRLPGVRLPPSVVPDSSRVSESPSITLPSMGTDQSASSPFSSLSSSGSISPCILTFRYSELSEATGNFTQGMVGMGSFGSVFKAEIRGNGPYAIKKLHSESEMEGGLFYETFHHETFSQEVQLLTKYHHRNILSLVACSNDGPRPCLVYEYMENGSLADCLLGKRYVHLPWKLRLGIANQIADALHFLHTVNQLKCLVHGDVKSANILLDAYCTPKLSDFGLARECHTRTHQHSTYSTQSKVVMGTVAYMAPEFLRNRKLTRKTDVYSFGVVLLELFTGLAADDATMEQRTLTERLVHLFEDTDTHQREIATYADPRAEWPEGTGFHLFNIATVCLTPKGKDRPHMDQVRDQLSVVLQEADSSRWPYSGVS